MSPNSVVFFICVLFMVVVAKRERHKQISAPKASSRDIGDYEENERRKTKDENPTTIGTNRNLVGDAVVEKFVETLMASERYLKMIETVERKLNHLDATFHEKTNSILKYVSETLRMVKKSGSDLMEKALTGMKMDLDRLKQSVTTRLNQPTMRVEGTGLHENSALIESRLTTVENLVRGVMTGVDAIVATMTEVKNRQQTRSFARPADTLSTPMDTMSMLNEFRKVLHDQGRGRKCDCSGGVRSGRVDRAERYPTDCHEIQMQGFNISGIYKIKPEEMEPFYILCDLTTFGGGWTVFQNRYDGTQDFYKDWADYKYGFGNLAGEFWLGLEKLNYLTNQKLYELRVEMETQHGQEAYAGYSVFTVGPEYEGYRISTLGTYYGTAGDSLSYHAGQKFSTQDVDNDEWKEGSCATEHGGAWWYKECDKSNLNGKYVTVADENRGQSIYWISFKGPNYPLTKTKMMIRPLPASKPIDFGDANRKHIENVKVKANEPQKNFRNKDVKASFDTNQRHSPYRFEGGQAEAYFPNYA